MAATAATGGRGKGGSLVRRKRPRNRLPLAYRFAAGLLRPLMMLLTRHEWRGAENLPETGGFVVSPNHLSYIDPIAFAHFLYDNGHPPYFLAKEGVFRIPLVGRLLRAADQIPVYRGTSQAVEAFRAAVVAIEAGKCVPIFPEGTLTRDPDLWPMTGRTGAARVALTTQCPVVPVAQWGPQEVLEPYGKRPRFFPRKTMHVWAGPAVDLSDLYGQPLDRATLREATDRIMDAITGLLEQIRGEQAPAQRFDVRSSGLPETGNPRRARREPPAGAAGGQG